MTRCTNCGSTDAHVDLGLCFACFAPDPQPPPTDAEICAGYGHPEYAPGEGRCYCGAVQFPDADTERRSNGGDDER